MSTNLPPYARCDAGTCPGHDEHPDVHVFGAVLPLDLDDRGAEAAIALAAGVALTYRAQDDTSLYDPTLGIHKGPVTSLDGRKWTATAVRSEGD